MFKMNKMDNQISKKDFKFIGEATYIASNSPCYSQHGCVLVQNGKIISRGYNNFNQSCLSCSSQTTHAEIDALSQCFQKRCLKEGYHED
jgi:deoxycytidylate deaminase